MTHQRGIVAEWTDDRGFGFITPSDGGARAFVHVSAFPRGQRPAVGDRVTYVLGTDERGRPRASAVRYLASSRSRRTGARGRRAAYAATSVFAALLAGLAILDRVPGILVAAYAVLSVVAIVMYRLDKTAALRGEWRISESSLHLVALVGGWPGAMVARPLLMHKTTKQPFRTIFWCTVVINCAALAWFLVEVPVTLD